MGRAVATSNTITTPGSAGPVGGVALRATLALAAASFRLHLFHRAFVRVLGRRIGTALQRNADDAVTLSHVERFGAQLEAFFLRVVEERPSAARALLRFVSTYVTDVSRRRIARRAGLPALATVVIDPTDRCNLACPGCYAAGPGGRHDLPFDAMVRVVQEAIGMGATLITLSGGEPFLREHADGAVTRLAAKFPNHGFLVYTNGTLIDAAVSSRLGRLGNVFPAVSVEGFQPDTDARRGTGVHDAGREARQRLAHEGVMTGFSATVTRENADAISTDEFLDQRIREGDLFGWFFLLQPIGRSPRPDLMVTASQRLVLRDAVRRWRRAGRPIFLGDFWNDGALVGGCLAGGRYYFHVRANGDVGPCVFAPVTFGNVLEIGGPGNEFSSLKDLIQRHPGFVAFREEQARISDRSMPCPLIDHPDAFRRVASVAGCQRAANMPAEYLGGAIADVLDRGARELSHLVHEQP
jgi:MoaA/NifB/PqqE/SkfB family radical SAM enzyme